MRDPNQNRLMPKKFLDAIKKKFGRAWDELNRSQIREVRHGRRYNSSGKPRLRKPFEKMVHPFKNAPHMKTY